MTKTTLPIASGAPKKERRFLARFRALGFDIDVVINDAESLFIVFMTGDSHRCRIMADDIKLQFSYFFNLSIIPPSEFVLVAHEPTEKQISHGYR